MNGEPDYTQIKSKELVDLIKKMLTKNPNDRIEIIDICLHKWVTNNDQDSVNLDLSEVSDLSEGHSLEEDSKFPGFEFDVSPDCKLDPSPIVDATESKI
jgi:serine/threonine protein kinase